MKDQLGSLEKEQQLKSGNFDDKQADNAELREQLNKSIRTIEEFANDRRRLIEKVRTLTKDLAFVEHQAMEQEKR